MYISRLEILQYKLFGVVKPNLQAWNSFSSITESPHQNWVGLSLYIIAKIDVLVYQINHVIKVAVSNFKDTA
ncbi:hypothetical protein WA1_50515 [Scytonema hofmannii PCC 7110]|uniref:Uncharacterized protein n=1 Tax=Scytonema hofmannii PCC 7110 TaxID=128403 RepID=A0A139WQE8_9CYAN|nr:hypothetical protein WA1_50515 [Scytonema hofmannii PCC 7110]